MDTAARVLSLAQQTADQAIADARREADETLGRARREADEVLTKARRQAEQITGDARARAESLERDAQERHRQAMGSLVQQREELERRVDDLRAFEREYRSRLKAYLEGQLRDLEAGVTDSGAFPTMGSTPQPAIPAGLGQPQPAQWRSSRPVSTRCPRLSSTQVASTATALRRTTAAKFDPRSPVVNASRAAGIFLSTWSGVAWGVVTMRAAGGRAFWENTCDQVQRVAGRGGDRTTRRRECDQQAATDLHCHRGQCRRAAVLDHRGHRQPG